ncbi:tRNA-uridine aminocarboxypropyltransferase [Vibrio hippocampi]|uniref:tRNA-uridine aminocarboxypropyltransferase n=1 Tax=Vibrio hippocampi TaxID=654686 RepID=A0ABN8DJ36_9VIBR|nr:DTW domain-containing protein [Vibrio hippocampi]CAH0526592.1 hypothetical protein VHP8226_01946 [Vibrio hippocampi]
MSRYCPNCLKAGDACFCRWIQPLTSQIELIILQHPSEEKRPLGTARILSLSLHNARLFVGEDFSEHQPLLELINDPAYQTVVLYPTADSSSIAQREMGDDSLPLRVILIDGTWKKAYKMWNINHWLHELPQIHLPEALEGDYRIRKAPKANALSTVEAGYHLLSLLQPELDFKPLLTTFEQMIEYQIKRMPPEVYQRNYGDK